MTTCYGAEAKRQLDASYPEWETIQSDEQVKVCHANCPAGEDTRDRFSITNKGGAFLYHCFNCGNSGYFRPKDSFSPIVSPSSRGVVKEVDWYSWWVAKQDAPKFPTEARLWLAEYEMLDHVIEYDIKYSPETHSLLLPIINNVPVGWQQRNFAGGFKYTTHVRKDVPLMSTLRRKEEGRPLILVEDLLSSYKLHLAGANSCAMLGTSLKGNLPEHEGKVVVWLDDDAAGHDGALKLVKELAPLYKNMDVVFNTQPKEIPLDELISMVELWS